MKFSVIIPVYNGEKYLSDCLGNLLGREYCDFEIVLVNDGSADSTPAICDDFKEKYPDRIKVIHKKNSGQLQSRCKAISEASGEYLVFLDVDDSFSEDYFEFLCDIIERNNYPDMVVFSFYYDRKGKLESSVPIYDREVYYADKIPVCELFINSIKLNNVWTKAVKREVFDGEYPDYAEFSSLRMAEDRFHSMGMVDNCNTFVFTPKQLYLYKVSDSSISHSYSIEKIENYNISILYQAEKRYFEKWNLLNADTVEKLNAVFLGHCYWVFDNFYSSANRKERAKILSYDWTSFCDKECFDNFESNRFLSPLNKMLVCAIVENDFKDVKSYFFRKEAKKTIKQFIGRK